MIFQLTAKNCKVLPSSRAVIENHLEKFRRLIFSVDSDLVVLRLVIKKNADKYYPPRSYPHKYKTYSDSKPSLACFEGSLSFRLNGTRFYSYFKGQTMDEAVRTGFEHIFTEVEKYKDLHFPSESEYPDRESIRERFSSG